MSYGRLDGKGVWGRMNTCICILSPLFSWNYCNIVIWLYLNIKFFRNCKFVNILSVFPVIAWDRFIKYTTTSQSSFIFPVSFKSFCTSNPIALKPKPPILGILPWLHPIYRHQFLYQLSLSRYVVVKKNKLNMVNNGKTVLALHLIQKSSLLHLSFLKTSRMKGAMWRRHRGRRNCRHYRIGPSHGRKKMK